MVNRIWKRLMGLGMVESVQDWEGRTPAHAPLLDWLAKDFMANGYNLRHLCRRICSSDAWQRQGQPKSNQSAPHFLSPQQGRMTAEQVVDSLRSICGPVLTPETLTFDPDSSQNPQNFLNLGELRKAWQFASLANERDRQALALPKAQAFYDVLEAFGWRSNRPDAVSDRPLESTALQPAILANGVLTHSLLRLSAQSPFTTMACGKISPEELIDQVWRHFLSRLPTTAEKSSAMELVIDGFDSRLTNSAPLESTHEDPDLVYRRISWTNHLVSEASEIKMRIEKAVRRGPSPTQQLKPDWRERFEDLLWSLANHPEFLQIP
jgi:hypothetical protein